MYFVDSAYNVPPMYIKKKVHLKAHYKVPYTCTLKAHCKVHLQLDYKCALHDYSNVHQMYIVMQVCYVLCKVHVQGTFQVVFKVHLRYKKM